MNWIKRYAHWLHLKWPAGRVERLPRVNDDGSTNVPGFYVVGDLTGVPLLKFSADSGAKAVRSIGKGGGEGLDLVIVGGGVSGMAAALEATKLGLRFEVIEASEPFSTIANFPKAKPIYTYPAGMTPAGDLQFREEVHPKETLLEELRAQTVSSGISPRIGKADRVERVNGRLRVHLEGGEAIDALAVIVAIGRSGNYRKLNVPGEDKADKVFNRLHDPRDYANLDVLVVGGGDSALETAIAIAQAGGRVTLVHRKAEFSRPKPDNIEQLARLRSAGKIKVMMGTSVREIRDDEVALSDGTIANTVVFTMIGREPPLDFFRRSGSPIRGEWRASTWISLILVLLAFIFIYHWKKSGVTIADAPLFRQVARIGDEFSARGWFPYNVPAHWRFDDKASLPGTMKVSLGEPGFYYSLAYCLAVVLFGIKRINRRKTPYVRLQTYTLMAIQVIPLFLLPYILLPWMGNNGYFDSGAMGWIADQLFPKANYGHGREYWRAFGLILAWPLFIWNVFTSQPMWLWLGISFVQTFVLIPLIIYWWGKGAYCGWICSCGALAETLGDAHRHKMPHGPEWNRVNFVGQAFLLFALVLLILRGIAWAAPSSFAGRAFDYLFSRMPLFNYVWFVDLLWAGILGVGLYWHFSGRVWCRFACPLAALMHIYARFSRFRILADKKKCISCNVCTSVCHQGIDVMSFANKGQPMADPQCVRCSACVQMCPTGVLSFGQIDRASGATIKMDKTPASLVQMTVKGRS